MHRIVISDAARGDLDDIGSFVSEISGERVADRLVERLIAKIDGLKFAPRSFGAHEDLFGLRFVVVAKYLIFFRVTDDLVIIARVLHGARRIHEELFR